MNILENWIYYNYNLFVFKQHNLLHNLYKINSRIVTAILQIEFIFGDINKRVILHLPKNIIF
jgi:hypothetical protein